ncbi:Lysosome membrane protein 2-like protein [Leptotrombidium deliense]|uniref:Lysosome membrane protein 2-like protein n=1 Tax=Leptotrombidium deliense TaxID=299467 RepID=A0A443S6S9_9ACAR|nr:Lysosome membrane protein 2-like protein [Leptotrombidium deliense]
MTALLQFHNQNLFTTKTVRELLFDGYRVNVLDTINLISMPLKIIGISIPYVPLINNTFGIFHNKNNTPEGPFEVFTGIDDYTKIGQFVAWKDKVSLNHWKGKECNVLNGTDGIQFSPFLKKEQILSVFIFDACRSILLGFDKETEVKGIKTYRFKTLQSSFHSATKNSDNWCYCNVRKKSCNHDGVIDISPCWFNAPLYASHPHFYNASKRIFEKVKGLQPDGEKHTSYVDIEPTTGSVLRGARRFALNVEIKNFPIISSSRNILKPAIIPILWVEESSQLSDELRDEMNSKLFMTKMVAEVGIKFLIAAGFALLSIVLRTSK